MVQAQLARDTLDGNDMVEDVNIFERKSVKHRDMMRT